MLREILVGGKCDVGCWIKVLIICESEEGSEVTRQCDNAGGGTDLQIQPFTA
jgi:hypothetical protein